MQLTYRGQTYNYPDSEPTQVSNLQPLCIYRGIKMSVAFVAPKTTVSGVTSLCYRGVFYRKTLTPAFD
ncbi:MAG: DUF4278 domain-containing protein [Oculatellaceae cyanobacterium bins.114]|nr:DUF4278 domain-containing protein [Oculatellaceae cyanobacterium bins.114]